MAKTTYRHEFSRRLNELLDHYDYPSKYAGRQVQLKKDFNVSQETARKWLSGEAIPRPERLLEICERFPCRREWLEYGEGPMLDDPVLKRLNDLIYKASPEDRETFLKIAEKMLAEYR